MEKAKLEALHTPAEVGSIRTPLHDQFDAANPVYPDCKTALAALTTELELLAESLKTNIETLLRDAHAATCFRPQYRTALNLERQINLLKS